MYKQLQNMKVMNLVHKSVAALCVCRLIL